MFFRLPKVWPRGRVLFVATRVVACDDLVCEVGPRSDLYRQAATVLLKLHWGVFSNPVCHPECSEGSTVSKAISRANAWNLHFVQNDYIENFWSLKHSVLRGFIPCGCNTPKACFGLDRKSHGEVTVAPDRATGGRATPPASGSNQCLRACPEDLYWTKPIAGNCRGNSRQFVSFAGSLPTNSDVAREGTIAGEAASRAGGGEERARCRCFSSAALATDMNS